MNEPTYVDIFTYVISPLHNGVKSTALEYFILSSIYRKMLYFDIFKAALPPRTAHLELSNEGYHPKIAIKC